MGKWIAGLVLVSITMVFIILSMFFTWYSVTVDGGNVGLYPLEVAQNLGRTDLVFDNKSHSITTEYSLLTGKSTTTIAAYFDTNGDGKGDSSTSKEYDIATRAKPENNYIPMGGSIADGGRPAELELYNLVYFFYIIAILAIIASIPLLILGGLGKIPKFVPKISIGVLIAFTALAPLYFAFFQPMAVDNDAKDRHDYQVAEGIINQTDYKKPEQAKFFMGTEYSQDPYYQKLDVTTSWGPSIGWFLAVGGLILSIIAIGNTRPTRRRKDAKAAKSKQASQEAPEPEPEPSVPCPICGRGLKFIDTTQAYYCYTCQTYPDLTTLPPEPQPPLPPPLPPEAFVPEQEVEPAPPSDDIEW